MVEQVQRELYPERHFLCVFNTLVMMTMRIIMMIMMLLLVMNQCFEKSPGIQLEVGSLVLVEAAVRMVEEPMRKMGGSQMRLSLVPLQRRLVWGRRWTVERKRRGERRRWWRWWGRWRSWWCFPPRRPQPERGNLSKLNWAFFQHLYINLHPLKDTHYTRQYLN